MRNTIKFAVALAGGIVLASARAHAAECYDVSKGEPRSLTGVLDYVIFAGPPNFEDVRKGDTPEPTYILRLDAPICITGDDFADPHKRFSAVQLSGGDATWNLLKSNLHREVTVNLADPTAAFDGHHHEPLLAGVTNIRASSRRLNFIDEYGTPATTIRAFYEALADGEGDVASMMIVPEKRNGPFAPDNLSRFYGHLREPLRLIGIDQSGPSTFVAHYRYVAEKSVCNGSAAVSTVVRGSQNLIQSIKAMKGC
jgi:hypothetical protein